MQIQNIQYSCCFTAIYKLTQRRFIFIFLQDPAICGALYLTATALCLPLKNNLVKSCIPVKIRETPLGQDISLKVRNLLHDRLHFPSCLFTPVPLRFEISLLESLFTPAFQAYKKRPRKQPPKQPHRALLNSCVCSGHRCHIYFVTCPGYPNKTYPLLKLPHHPCPSHFRDICRFLPLLRLQKAVLPAKTISPSYSRG